MELIVSRNEEHEGSTIGVMTKDGEHLCYTLEDGYQEEKIHGETRIPKGTYEIKFRTEGGFHARYSKRYGEMHKGMLEVCNVPDFTYILIHTGNDKSHTRGCTLVGTSYSKGDNGFFVSSSRNAYKAIYPEIAEHLLNGDRVTIEYQDNDREAD